MVMVQTAARTHCPTCGARLARPELSICAYCAAPLGLEEEVREPTETMRRLERMTEHEKFPDAIAWEPPREIEDLAATALGSRGLLLIGFALFFGLLTIPWTLLFGGPFQRSVAPRCFNSLIILPDSAMSRGV